MDSSLEPLRTRSRRLQQQLLWLIAVLAVLVLLERFSAPLLALVRPDAHATAGRQLTLQLIAVVPDLLFLLALNGIRLALAAIGRGELFAPTLQQMLARVGRLLALGALVRVVLVPVLNRALGEDPGYWFTLDVSGLVLGAIGLALGILARVLQHAARVQAELDEMF